MPFFDVPRKDRGLVDTTNAKILECPRCGKATLSDPGEKYAMCVGCLFDLALHDAEPVATSQDEATYPDLPVVGRLGEYELIEEIGRGGMGIIYKARAANGTGIVAVKALLPGLGDEHHARERFERETRAMASLSHPSIMPIHEVHLEGTTPFFAMDYASAGSLADLLPKYRTRWRQAAQLVAHVARAIHYAHTKGLIHRDLKPGNILFTQDLDPLVSDFGLAKWLDDTGANLTQSLVMFGTPSYVSPEQASGERCEPAPTTDIYSLGAILFELLASRPPYAGDNPLQVLKQVLAGPAPRLRSVAPTVPVDLEAICTQCLQTNPKDRYVSAADLADDIERWLSGGHVVARRRFKEGLPAKLFERRLFRTGAAAALTVAVIGALYLPLRSWNSDRRTVASPFDTFAVSVEIDDFSPNGELSSFPDQLSRTLSGIFDDAHVQVLPVRRLVAAAETGSSEIEGAKLTPAGTRVALRESVRRVDSRVRVVSKIFDLSAARLLQARIDWLPLQAKGEDFHALQQALREELLAERSSRSQEHSRGDPADTKVASFCKKAAEFFHRINRADNDHAITLYENALALQPNNVSALAGLADAYRMKFYWWGGNAHDMELARHSAEQALAADPFSAEAHHAMGWCFVAAKRFEEAREELLQELELDPESPGGNAQVGVCYQQLGQPRQALPWLLRAARLDPAHGIFNLALGEIYMLTGDDKQAEKELRRATEIDPDHPDARGALAVLALWQDRSDDARELCRDILTHFPDYTYREQLAAEVAFFCGDSAEALARYSRMAIIDTYSASSEFFGAINPNSAIACLLQKEGNHNEASRRLADAGALDEQLLSQFPDNPRLLHDLAAIWALKGDHERAIACLSSAFRAGWVERRSTLVDPRFESLRDDQRFVELLAQTVP